MRSPRTAPGGGLPGSARDSAWDDVPRTSASPSPASPGNCPPLWIGLRGWSQNPVQSGWCLSSTRGRKDWCHPRRSLPRSQWSSAESHRRTVRSGSPYRRTPWPCRCRTWSPWLPLLPAWTGCRVPSALPPMLCNLQSSPMPLGRLAHRGVPVELGQQAR